MRVCVHLGGASLSDVCRGGWVRKCSTYALTALATTGTASTHQSPAGHDGYLAPGAASLTAIARIAVHSPR
jgi:hypothetical protein